MAPGRFRVGLGGSQVPPGMPWGRLGAASRESAAVRGTPRASPGVFGGAKGLSEGCPDNPTDPLEPPLSPQGLPIGS